MPRRLIYPLFALVVAAGLLIWQNQEVPVKAPAKAQEPAKTVKSPDTGAAMPRMAPLKPTEASVTEAPKPEDVPAGATAPTGTEAAAQAPPVTGFRIPKRPVPPAAMAKGTILHTICQDLGIDPSSEDAAELFAWVMHRAQKMEEAAGPGEPQRIKDQKAREAYNQTLRQFRDHLVDRFGRVATDKVLRRVALEPLGAEGWPAFRLTAEGEQPIPVRRGEEEESEDG